MAISTATKLQIKKRVRDVGYSEAYKKLNQELENSTDNIDRYENLHLMISYVMNLEKFFKNPKDINI